MNNAKPQKRIDEGLPEFTLRDILSPIFRHQRLVFTVFGFVFLLSILFAWLWVANYYATAIQIVVQQDRSDPAVTTGQNAAVQTGREFRPARRSMKRLPRSFRTFRRMIF